MTNSQATFSFPSTSALGFTSRKRTHESTQVCAIPFFLANDPHKKPKLGAPKQMHSRPFQIPPSESQSQPVFRPVKTEVKIQSNSFKTSPRFQEIPLQTKEEIKKERNENLK